MKFYNKLLKLIDKEITGVENEHNDIIKFLVNRLEQDLKKESKMKHMFKLAPAQKNLKLLEILRQKVVVRYFQLKIIEIYFIINNKNPLINLINSIALIISLFALTI